MVKEKQIGCLILEPETSKQFEAIANLMEYEYNDSYRFWFGILLIHDYDDSNLGDVMIQFSDGRRGAAHLLGGQVRGSSHEFGFSGITPLLVFSNAG